MGRNKDIKRAKEERDLQRLRFEEEVERILSTCDHKRKKDGSLDLKVIDYENKVFECNICGVRFSSRSYTEQERKEALMVIEDIIHQTKCLTPKKKRDEEDDDAPIHPVIKLLGQLSSDLKVLDKVYVSYKKSEKKNKEKKNYNNDDYIEKFGPRDHFSARY
jgi:hypothetical protein